MSTELATKYRPRAWEDVVGQDVPVKSIQEALKRKAGRAFLLTGPSGVGKTTLARLIALQLGLEEDAGGYYELDAATRTGVDDMRAIKEMIRLSSLSENQNRVICLDEAHMLSKNAWNALLKDVEEPPRGVYWVLCTTEPTKVPDSIRSRCMEHELVPVSEKKLEGLLSRVIHEEGLNVSDPIFDMLIDAARGSPRVLLTGLAKVVGITDPDEAERALQTISADGNKDIADFCKALYRDPSWQEMMGILKRMESPSAEGIRAVVCAWFSKAALNAKDRQSAERAVAILSAFGTPYPGGIGSSLHPVLVSLGELLLLRGD